MNPRTRKILDRSFTGFGLVSIFLLTASLFFLLSPIFYKGISAFLFDGTIEFRKIQFDKYQRGNKEDLEKEILEASSARNEVYRKIEDFENSLKNYDFSIRRQYKSDLREIKELIHELLGPAPGKRKPVLIREQYGKTRWDRAQVTLNHILYREEWDYSDTTSMGKKVLVPREKDFAHTEIEPLFQHLEKKLPEMLLPQKTLYWQFLIDDSMDAHFFGGIWPEILGTFYLTIGAMVFAVPLGVIAAIYLTEYAKEGKLISALRICISTLAGVPSIVFGLFGLAFFINTLGVSQSKSVLAGSMTLALLILPTIIRASEEAIMAVPKTYKEAALSLGATKWHTVMTVIIPAALPGILTGIVISMGRAAGETAPIIFTAAVSVGKPLQILEIFNQPTPALSWNIYNLCTEHEAVDEIRHVQYGMVLTLVALVLLLNLAAIITRAKISKKLRG